MNTYFIDSSALVKHYIPETGTKWIRSITNPQSVNTILIAHITQVEVVSAVMRQHREQRISQRTARAMRLLLDRHVIRYYTTIGLTHSIISRAEQLLEDFPLRAYDAVQLASAVESHTRITLAGLPPLTFVCSDHRLLLIAISVGLKTDDPNLHP